MSFCIKPNVCKKCGKPLTLFEGWYCLECEAKEHTSDKLYAIMAEIEQNMKNADVEAKKTQDDIDCGISIGLKMALDTVDKYTKGDQE